ncbi:hypothetical protein BDW02DRAFT_268274 [Decorospora gaudefroyi]|uniref:Alcohol dehydrogenase-like N-terminal domain-containing protein n=1 Tax=Decorospora gaudefroyi TaxID=184978 RepID=A0A6A5JWA5_9PLEO|nr:hypothetical protein BDW02DRAFT_268274 [Decorospora gaudefroyi]
MSTSSTGNAMKAWTHTCSGLPPDVLTLSSLPVPTITAPTQILIQVSHCALNPGGSIIMQLLPFFFRASPAIPEMDFSGTVVSLGSGVPRDRKLEPGTPVFGTVPVSQHAKSTSGALAEYVVVDNTAIVVGRQGSPE